LTSDHIRGCLYGQAIGDALGIPIEFQAQKGIENDFGIGGYPTQYKASRGFEAGEWSDDTAQAIAIVDAYLQDPDLSPQTVAGEFMKWATKDGRGMGNLTQKVFLDSMFYMAPHAVAEDYWESTGRKAAPNGAVMRTAYVGLLKPTDLDWTEEAAIKCAKVSHFDPRCVASSVGISILVAMLVQGASLEDAHEEAVSRMKPFDGQIRAYTEASLSYLNLDEGMWQRQAGQTVPIGFTYKTMGAGFWALRRLREQPCTFMDALGPILNAGGDSDTNGAVAGAVLGATLGYDALPEHLTKGLYDDGRLVELWKALT